MGRAGAHGGAWACTAVFHTVHTHWPASLLIPFDMSGRPSSQWKTNCVIFLHRVSACRSGCKGLHTSLGMQPVRSPSSSDLDCPITHGCTV